jgi:hypothetical protein
MDNELRFPLTDLATGSMLRLPDAQGRVVVAFEGCVWITQEGDPSDVVLDGGQSFCVDRQGLTLVQALRPSKLMVLGSEGGALLGTDVPDSVALYQQARQQRSQAMARAIAKGWSALRRLLTAPAPRAPQRPAALRVCAAVH